MTNDENKKYFGSRMILKENVKYIHDDPDLELYAKCCDEVCKIFVEVQKEKAHETDD